MVWKDSMERMFSSEPEGFVEVIQIGVDTVLLVLEPHEISKQLSDPSRPKT
jgi:hypothetical protein